MPHHEEAPGRRPTPAAVRGACARTRAAALRTPRGWNLPARPQPVRLLGQAGVCRALTETPGGHMMATPWRSGARPPTQAQSVLWSLAHAGGSSLPLFSQLSIYIPPLTACPVDCKLQRQTDTRVTAFRTA